CPLLRPPRSTLLPYTTLFRSWKSSGTCWAFSSSFQSFGKSSHLKDIDFWFSTGSLKFAVYLKLLSPALRTSRFSILPSAKNVSRSEEHTSELQSRENLVCRLL